jgi:hypothetical protein
MHIATLWGVGPAAAHASCVSGGAGGWEDWQCRRCKRSLIPNVFGGLDWLRCVTETVRLPPPPGCGAAPALA